MESTQTPPPDVYVPPIYVVGAVAATREGRIEPRVSIVLDDLQSIAMTSFAEFSHHSGIYLCVQDALAVADTIRLAAEDIVLRVEAIEN